MRSTRPLFLPGHFYHFFNRGARRVSIFRETENYLFVIRKIKKYCQDFRLAPVAYCLMPNHYHFLIRQDGDQKAGLLPQRIFNSYTKAYNKRYQSSGTLFEGHYQVADIEERAHLLQLCRYIHANPVKDGLVGEPGDWPYSNYLEWIDARSGILVDREFVQAHFPTPGAYKRFVADYLRRRDLPDEVRRYLNAIEE